MYRVMIIDDEKALRKLLRASIDWQSLGLEVAGEAASGIEAINTIDKIRPDIVFVDIRMPFMDGIEFAKIAMQRYERIRVIILTAFDEFEYARSCVGVGIVDYLLKPIVRTDVVAACKKAIEQLDQMAPQELAATEHEEATDMQRVRDYIRDNYDNAELNLTSTAQKFGYNSSYLSRRFKSELSMNVSDYILKCRMEKAQECVKKRMLMYVAAKQVGIPDPNYFGKCFKKYTGCSYSEMLKTSD